MPQLLSSNDTTPDNLYSPFSPPFYFFLLFIPSHTIRSSYCRAWVRLRLGVVKQWQGTHAQAWGYRTHTPCPSSCLGRRLWLLHGPILSLGMLSTHPMTRGVTVVYCLTPRSDSRIQGRKCTGKGRMGVRANAKDGTGMSYLIGEGGYCFFPVTFYLASISIL